MRKGLTVGSGRKGYYNIQCNDPRVHSQSAKGIKQPQRIPQYPISRTQKRWLDKELQGFDIPDEYGGKNTKGNFHFSGRYTLREINGAWYVYDREKNTTIDRLNAHTFTKAEVEFSNWKRKSQGGKIPFSKIKAMSDSDTLPFDKKGMEIDHFPIETAVIIPSTQDYDKKLTKKQFNNRVRQSEKELGKLLDGYTKVDTVGGFYDKRSKKIIDEKGAKITIFADRQKLALKSDAYKEWILAKQKQWGQRSIGFETEGDLYYLSKKK